MRRFDSFTQIINYAMSVMRTESELVHPATWQSLDVSGKPDMATHEIQNFHAECGMQYATVHTLQIDCNPSLPWAEDHFLERVCGEPLNPGNTWKAWPYALKADGFRDDKGQFNHNYMERYWPQYAGHTFDGAIHEEFTRSPDWQPAPHVGIRHHYGDLQDVVNLFTTDPLTRQAFVPIFFPEDTGAHHGGRVPCTLGYHFMIRRDQLHIVYFMRSCDLRRHFNDDLYLTARLNLWLIEQLKAAAPSVFQALKPGTFSVFISSLHIFRNDWYHLFGNEPKPRTSSGGQAHGVVSTVTGRLTTAAQRRPAVQSLQHTSGPRWPGSSFGRQQIARDTNDK